MAEVKKYLLEMQCDTYEVHEGEKWIGDEELEKIKKQAVEGAVSESCSLCQLTVKDKDGNVILIKKGC